MSTALTPAQKKIADTKRSLRAMLEKGAQEFAAVLPAHLTPERLIRIAMTACTVQPKLLDCSQESVALALLSASQCGLEPDGYHAHLVPYGRTCQFIPDFKGLIQLALENDVVIDAYAVYEKDTFHYQLGTDPKIYHEPSDESDRGALRCAYAVAHFGKDRVKFVVATRFDVEKRRDSSKASGPDSPWKKWEAEMWIKTAVKMLAKYIPRSQRLRAALVHDDTAEMGLQQRPDVVDAVSARKLSREPSKTETLAATFAKRMDDNTPAEEGGVEAFSLHTLEQYLGFANSSEDVEQVFITLVESRKETLTADEYSQAEALCATRQAAISGAV